MNTYEEQNSRWNLFRGGVGIAAIGAAIAGRRQIGQLVLRGMETAATRLAQTERETARMSMTNFADKISTVINKGILKRAEMSIAEQRLGKYLGEEGWESHQVQKLFGYNNGAAPYRRISRWVTGNVDRIPANIRGHEYQELVDSFGGRHDVIEAQLLEARKRLNNDRLFSGTLGHATQTGQKGIVDSLQAQVKHAQEEHKRLLATALRKKAAAKDATLLQVAQGNGSWTDLIAKHVFGAERATIGDVLKNPKMYSKEVHEQAKAAHASLLGTLGGGSAKTINDLPLGELWKTAGGAVHDTRGFSSIIGRGNNWIVNNVEVPLMPYMGGFTPTRLFPWLSGEVKDPYTLITKNSAAKQALLPGLAKNNADIALMGDQLLEMNFVDSVGVKTSTRHIAGSYTALHAESGFASHIMKNLSAYEESLRNPHNPTGVFDKIKDLLSIGRQPQSSTFTEYRSILAKFQNPDSFEKGSDLYKIAKTYPAGAISRIYDSIGTGVKADHDDIRTMANFLRRTGSIDAGMVEKTMVPGMVKSPELHEVFSNLTNDNAVLKFFQSNGNYADNAESSVLKNMLNEFELNPGEVLTRTRQAQSHSPFMDKILGTQEPKAAVDLMRDALTDEYALKYGFPIDEKISPLTARIRDANGTNEELERAKAFVYGNKIKQTLEIDGEDTAYELLTRSDKYANSIRDNARYMVDNRLGFMDLHVPPQDSDGPQTLLIKNKIGIVDSITRANDVLKKGGSWKDSFQALWDTGVAQQYTTALVKGPESGAWTRASLTPYFFESRMNDALAEFGVGLNPEDLGSAGRILGGLIGKRVLPAVGIVEAWKYANYESEKVFGTSPDDAKANIRANAKLSWAGIHDWGRFTKLYAGSEYYLSGQDREETKAQLERGYVPIRKGRFWAFGTKTPFYGDKIENWMPDPYQLDKSNWQAAENTDYNSDDYWAHSIMPTLRYPLSPLRHFTDAYWWEHKHSEGARPDRPYTVSGPLFTPEAAWGPALNATIGKILKPRRVLNPDYLPESMGGNISKRDIERINRNIKGGGSGNSTGIVGGAAGGEGDVESDGVMDTNAGSLLTISPAGGMMLNQLPEEVPTDTSHMGTLGRSNGGGAKRVAKWEIEKINRQLKAGGGHLVPSRLMDIYGQKDGFSDDDLDFVGNAELGGYLAREHMGIYGWMAGIPLGDRTGKVVADSSRGYGYERKYWDANLGGLGGFLSEIGRRFMPKRFRNVEEYNPVPNAFAGTWMPGSDYFTNFQQGDPYTKLKSGEIRLPGQAYEMVHGNKLMQMRASSLGKTKDEIIQSMLFQQDPMSKYSEDATETGNQWHKDIQNKWQRMGILSGREQEIYDDKLGISGHLDAILNLDGGPVVADIKTMSDKRFHSGKVFEEHMDQLNFYMYETGIHSGLLTYVNRDNPTEVALHPVNFSKRRFNRDIAKVEAARNKLRGMADSGEISRASLYDQVTRFEILADTAPYSEEYRQLKSWLADSDQLSDAEHDRVTAAWKRAVKQKKSLDLHPYRFSSAKTQSENYTVQDILDANTIIVKESPNPIRLAGIRVSNERILDQYGSPEDGESPAELLFRQFGIRRGSKIQALVNADPQNRYAQDTLQTQHAVVMAGGTNINRELLRNGVGSEKEGEWTAAGVWARFSKFEIAKAAAWEKVAHADTLINTKLMRVRSPYEEYTRSQVYGKSGGRWESPWSSYVQPTIESYAAKGMVGGAIGGGFLAGMFFTSRKARMYAVGIGAAAGAASSLLRQAKEGVSGEAWIPGRTQSRRDIEEYYDTLKYIKYRRLYEYARQEAINEEGVDVEKIQKRANSLGTWRKDKIREMSDRRRELLRSGKKGSAEELQIRKDVKDLKSRTENYALGPMATQAILYEQKYRSTMYGADASGPFMNIFKAFPKYERELINGFIKDSTPEERKKIYRLLPKYEKRLLGNKLGIDPKDIPKRTTLNEYFKTHTLPGADWQGWNPDVNIDQLKARTVVEEHLDPMDFGLYPTSIAKAKEETTDIRLPTVHGSSADIQNSLNELLSAKGIRNLRVSVDLEADPNASEDKLNVDMNMRQDRHDDLVAALRDY